MNVQFGQGSGGTAHFCFTRCQLRWFTWGWRIHFPGGLLTFLVNWCCLSVSLHVGLSTGSWGFLTVWWLSFKGQEVEAACLLSPGSGYWHSVDFHCVLSVKLSQSPDSKGGDRDLTFPGAYVSHFGALPYLSDIVV